MRKTTFEKEYFTECRNWYGRRVSYSHFKNLDKRMTEHLIDGIPLQGKHILVVGVGYGYEVEVLQKAGAIITGIDISKHAIEVCRNNFKGEFFVHNIERPLDGKYDVIFAMSVIEHLKNPKKALENMYDALKIDGIMIASTPNGNSPYSIYDRRRDRTHIGIRTTDDWLSLMNPIGHSVLKTHTVQWIPFIWKLVRMPFGNSIIINMVKK